MISGYTGWLLLWVVFAVLVYVMCTRLYDAGDAE